MKNHYLNTRTISFFFFILINLFFLNKGSAFYEGAVSTSLGGAGIAAVDHLESQLLNPAALVHLRGMSFGMGTSNSNSERSNSGAWHLSFFENSDTSQIPAGFGYIQEKGLIDEKSYTHKDIYISAAEFLTPYLAIGLCGKQRISEYSLLPFNNTDTSSHTQYNGTVGLLLTPNQNLGFGFTANNFINNQSQTPTELRLSRTFGFGVTYIFANFLRFRTDYVWPIVKNDGAPSLIHGGFESFFTEWIALRAGLTKNPALAETNYSLGIGFVGPRFHINYGYEEIKSNPKQSQHSFDLVLPFW